MPTITATVPLSESVSNDIDLRQQRRGIVAIAVPEITSGDLYVQCAFDATSADFVRLLQVPFSAPTSGYLKFATGPGSCTIPWPSVLPVPSYMRLECAVPQEAPRAFSVLFN